MSRIATRFKELKQANRKGLITFVTAGDPEPSATVAFMHAMVAGGADILELGVPFSDPMAEGPVIQRASERALLHNVSLRDVMAMVVEFRLQDQTTPVVLMGYLNPVEMMGYEVFAKAAAEAGVDAAITVDLPPEEARPYIDALRRYDLDPIFLLAPTSTEERIARIGEQASGFVYYVSLKGVTGAALIDVAEVAAKMDEIRLGVDIPVAVGFGINTPETAAQVASVADAVVIGSAVVKIVEKNEGEISDVAAAVTSYLASIRAALDAIE